MSAPVKTRTVRRPKLSDGRTVYLIDRLDPPPAFEKGDGYDAGRNLLSAALIGPAWRAAGYVVGRRGEWRTRDFYTGTEGAATYPTVRAATAALTTPEVIA